MMKRFTFMLVAAMLATGASIAAPKNPDSKVAGNKLSDKIAPRVEKARNLVKTDLTVATRAEDYGEPIYEVEGTTKYYTKYATGLDWGEDYELVDAAACVVFGDNNDVYIRDVLTYWGMGTFIKGEINNGVIRVPLPQCVEYGYNVCLLKKNGFEYQVADIDYVEYIIDRDGTFIIDMPGAPEEYMIGYVEDYDGGVWTGDGDFYQEYTPFDGEFNEIPDGVATTEYMYKEENYGYPVEVAVDGNDLYIKGLISACPSGVIKATIDGNTAIVSQNQLIGEYYGYWLYTKCFSIVGDDWVLAPSSEGFKLSLDWENNVISSDSEYGLLINADLEEIFWLDYFLDFDIYIQETMGGTPAAPLNLMLDDYYFESEGIYYFGFEVPCISVEGLVLDDKNLYYSIYVDGELKVFEPNYEDYSYYGLEGPTTEIPFLFDNYYDIFAESITYRWVGIYEENYTTLGVQSIYKYEGNVTESNIVTLNVETGEVTNPSTGVGSLVNTTVLNQEYYDLTGRKVSRPSNGIYVVKSKMNDGSVKTSKVMVTK